MAEQGKLFYQNATASNYLIGYHTERPAVADEISRMQQINSQLAMAWGRQRMMALDDLETLLTINKTLRRLYDQSAGRYVESFDKLTTPLLGWTDYLSRD